MTRAVINFVARFNDKMVMKSSTGLDESRSMSIGSHYPKRVDLFHGQAFFTQVLEYLLGRPYQE